LAKGLYTLLLELELLAFEKGLFELINGLYVIFEERKGLVGGGAREAWEDGKGGGGGGETGEVSPASRRVLRRSSGVMVE
jgi:hypothetical protein